MTTDEDAITLILNAYPSDEEKVWFMCFLIGWLGITGNQVKDAIRARESFRKTFTS